MGGPAFHIRSARTADEIDAASLLFEAYAASLPVALEYQGFDTEIAELPGKYASPEGELLIAWNPQGQAIGCVGLRPLIEGLRCEMKRLYVAPEARGLGLGKALAKAIAEAARKRGYSELYLDTLPTMRSASRIYEKMGFRRIEPYYEPTPDGTIFMCLDL